MKERNNMLERMAVATDLASEPTPMQPLVEIIGSGRVLVENHRGVSAYDSKQICIKMRYGVLMVCGNRLELIKMTKQQLIISGEINDLHLCKGG